MPRRCAICTHPDKEAIDQALVGGTALSGLPRYTAFRTIPLVGTRRTTCPRSWSWPMPQRKWRRPTTCYLRCRISRAGRLQSSTKPRVPAT